VTWSAARVAALAHEGAHGVLVAVAHSAEDAPTMCSHLEHGLCWPVAVVNIHRDSGDGKPFALHQLSNCPGRLTPQLPGA